jgi:acetyl-CoA C-acetyltransferase
MRNVSVIGIGQTAVGEHWDKSLRMLAAEAIGAALADAGLTTVDAVYVGNGYSGSISSQTQVGALVADYAGLVGVEAYSMDAGDASGGAALRTGYMAVASGAVDVVMVVGVEKMTDQVASDRVTSRNLSLDADFEAVHGATQTALAAMLMRRYMHEYGVTLPDFEGFSLNAHANGVGNPNAMFRKALRDGAFSKAPMVADPVSLFDVAPDADGAAAIILTASDVAADMVPRPVHIAASAVATDTFAVQDRADLMWLRAVEGSTNKALAQAAVDRSEIDLFELHDAYTILSVLALEAAGFAERGHGWELAAGAEKAISRSGEIPIATFGGLKSRGNPAGATGVYQAVEATLQLRHAAGDNQVAGAGIAMIQNLGGLATTAVTHILRV